eukprot:TRINITY_DN5432_c0_g1_i2.p1 TRINITY_DN5432_c0_g1~~TRINITY_DN5432_c0_g1_i2.p1  ORF type:complete len:114 (+),score=21.14 TRINITY_DN5432_c0_g1_i2:174-515(+)
MFCQIPLLHLSRTARHHPCTIISSRLLITGYVSKRHFSSTTTSLSSSGGKKIVLAIETSCDDTAVAIVRDDRSILSAGIKSQFEVHKKQGGIDPKIAKQHHKIEPPSFFLMAF